jgi:universal stress protein E
VVRRAIWLAKSTGAELELLVCYYNRYLAEDFLFRSPSLEKARNRDIASHEKHLEEIAAPLRAEGIAVKTSVAWDHPLHDGIVRQAVLYHADIVIKDSHHHSAAARALLTHTNWHLIRTCPTPLWLVKPHELAAQPAFIAAIDPNHEHDKPAALDDKILQLSKSIAGAVGGVVHAFHSYDAGNAVAAATANAAIPVSLPLDNIERQIYADHSKRFHEVTELHNIDDDKVHLVSGVTHEELPAIAEQIGADVVVMGAVARNRWKRLLIGATAERTLEHLPCDLLIVKPDWFKTPLALHGHEAA